MCSCLCSVRSLHYSNALKNWPLTKKERSVPNPNVYIIFLFFLLSEANKQKHFDGLKPHKGRGFGQSPMSLFLSMCPCSSVGLQMESFFSFSSFISSFTPLTLLFGVFSVVVRCSYRQHTWSLAPATLRHILTNRLLCRHRPVCLQPHSPTPQLPLVSDRMVAFFAAILTWLNCVTLGPLTIVQFVHNV